MVARAGEEPPFQLEDPLCVLPAPVAVEETSEGDEAAPAPPPPLSSSSSSCLADLSTAEVKSSETGLKYKDLKLGDGEEPPVGYQVVVNYVVMLSDGKVVSSTVESGFPADIRVGAGNVVKGIDEGILSMRSGGFRRLYVPGELSFQERLPSAPGRAGVPAQSSLIVDVNLLYIPGVD
jgi:peptidylprolyl isomerase